MRDLSSTGAKIELVLGRDTVVSSADGLPDRMTLFLVSDEMEVDGKSVAVIVGRTVFRSK